MTSKPQTRVAIHNARRMGKRAADVVLTVDGVDIKRDLGWKKTIRSRLERDGWDVLSLSIAVDNDRCDVVATCYRHGESPAAQERRKPVTRGGKPIEGPVKTGRTMGGKMRDLHGGRR